MPHESQLPPIDLPTHISTWSFLFGPTSTISRTPASQVGSFVDASTDVSINYHQLKTSTTNLSTALTKHHGLLPGQTVSLFSTNTIYYPVALFGVLHAGGVVSGASPAYTVDEMAYALKTADARFIFTLPGSVGVAVEAAEKVGMKKDRVFLLEGEMEGFTTLQELVELGGREKEQVEEFVIPEGKTNGEVCAFLSFSSGTTGLPKAVMISHQNIIAQCLQIQAITTPDITKVLAALPLFHITGIVHILHLPLLINASVILLPKFTLPLFLTAITTYKILEVLLVPPILIRLIRDPTVANYDLHHVKRWSTGAAPLSKEVVRELERKFPWMGMKHGYGMTESCSCITVTVPGDEGYEHAHTVGKVCASTRIKIVGEEDGREVPVGETGELWAKGPQVTMGYLGNGKATRETFDGEGYLHTGDVARIDADGRVEIVERIKEMIKVNGVQVAPAELEDLLLGHGKVEDVAVLGVPHEFMGEVPRAFVVLRERYGGEDRGVVEGELVEYVKRNRGAKTKWLRGGVQFVDTVPKSPSGKILRRVLREKYRTQDGVKQKAKL